MGKGVCEREGKRPCSKSVSRPVVDRAVRGRGGVTAQERGEKDARAFFAFNAAVVNLQEHHDGERLRALAKRLKQAGGGEEWAVGDMLEKMLPLLWEHGA